MNKKNVIVIFDVGKTNKKRLLFDEQYKLVQEESTQLKEIKDEDDFPCEDVEALTKWIQISCNDILNDKRYKIKGINISGYGASFVYLDVELKIIPPLYNYLKPYPPSLREKFYKTYGGENALSKQTASPILGNLNSGMQLYRMKYEKPEVFANIKYALHLPQYLSFIFSGNPGSDITSIGCHTHLWDFQNNQYHTWVKEEGILPKMAPVIGSNSIAGYINNTIPVGIGLHDSSAALIPYLISFNEPFLLLSTGTWCITLNPFNQTPLSDLELQQDCLCYLSYKGIPVKASRLFAGYEHEQQIKTLAEHFHKPLHYYKTVQFDLNIYNSLKTVHGFSDKFTEEAIRAKSGFDQRNLNDFSSYEEAYHQFVADLIVQQIKSTNLVLENCFVKRLFVDGGFSKNQIYMHLLAMAYPQMEVYSACLPQASALGAALAIHQHWNPKPLPTDIFDLKLYSGIHDDKV
ncbi:FGGY family carbohydrate kinase [Hydrotalea sp.]|uniref:FGGY-family carbohydrate kinase n=1 Tax=Hydrotalea sp. TaxID=2881279 RepID=UPI00258F3BF1|nr:FGGY family carbohydrate kinase [Hydrotalea sp.]